LSELDDSTLYNEEHERGDEVMWPVHVVRDVGVLFHRITLQLYKELSSGDHLSSVTTASSSNVLSSLLRDTLSALLKVLHDHSVQHAYIRGTLNVSRDALLPPPSVQLCTENEVSMYAHHFSWLQMLSACPFLLSTADKFKIMHLWLREEREHLQQNSDPIHVQIRRTHLLQDAFQRLNPLRRDLRRTIRVEFINTEGLAEAGIDGGGLFRELIHE
jgi:hypothetical protein